MTNEERGGRLLTRQEVAEKINVSHVTIWRWIKAREFPAPIEMGPMTVRWRESEVEAWLADRPRRRYQSGESYMPVGIRK